MIDRVVLGTSQLMRPYGINNKEKNHNLEKAFKILNLASHFGVQSFDTSPIYQESEKILGNFFKNNNKVRFTSKLVSLSSHHLKTQLNFNIKNFIKDQLETTLKNLKVDSIENYTIHDENDYLFRNGEIIENLLKFKNIYFKNLGISIYSEKLCAKVISEGYIDLIQVPYNLFDDRFISYINAAKLKNIKTQIRSIFLQGLIFMSKKNYNKKFDKDYDKIKSYQDFCVKNKIEIYKLPILDSLKNANITKIIMGVDNFNQCKKNLSFISTLSAKKLKQEISYNKINLSNDIINPQKWN